MTFGGHIVYLWPESYHLHPCGARVQGTQINYMPSKSHVIIVSINSGGNNSMQDEFDMLLVIAITDLDTNLVLDVHLLCQNMEALTNHLHAI